jgi:hypothetical protein
MRVRNPSLPFPTPAQADLVRGSGFAVRRGAAFGLAGCIKGFGIAVLKSNDIMTALEEAAADKAPEPRQGALFAFECLSEALGILFEPYVIRILPLLLKAFGDQVDFVRDAAHGASKVRRPPWLSRWWAWGGLPLLLAPGPAWRVLGVGAPMGRVPAATVGGRGCGRRCCARPGCVPGTCPLCPTLGCGRFP